LRSYYDHDEAIALIDTFEIKAELGEQCAEAADKIPYVGDYINLLCAAFAARNRWVAAYLKVKFWECGGDDNPWANLPPCTGYGPIGGDTSPGPGRGTGAGTGAGADGTRGL
jgi:hypothetical protein